MTDPPRVLDVALACEYGIGPRRLAGKDYVRITAGAYLSKQDAAELRHRCEAILHKAPTAGLSHWTAVALHDMPLPMGRDPEPFHVLVPPGRRAPRRRGVVAHTSDRHIAFDVVGSLRVTDLVRTWCDLARSGGRVTELVIVGDAMARRRNTIVPELGKAVGAGFARRGVATARTALPLIDARSESAMESLVRVAVHVAGLPAPVPQFVVRDCEGRFIARVDFAWPEHRLIVEYDGAHHRDQAQWAKDLKRRERLEAAGWTVIVLTAADVLGDPCEMIARIAARLP